MNQEIIFGSGDSYETFDKGARNPSERLTRDSKDVEGNANNVTSSD